MLTILCTHCHQPAEGPDRVDVGEATFCSTACRDADAAALESVGDIRVLVALVHNLPVVHTKVMLSMMAIGWGNRIARVKEELGIAAIDMACFMESPRVDDLRNKALVQAQRDGFTHVLFLDTDMLHPDDLFARILRHARRAIVVSGFYTQRQYPFAPIALRDGVLHESGRYASYKHDDDYLAVDADGLRDEDVVGMGCTLIPLAIVRALGPRPWFEYKPDVDGWAHVSEDVPFCERVKAAGFRVCLDPSIKCGHLYSDVATEKHWEQARAVIEHTKTRLQEALDVTLNAPAGVGS